MQEQVILLLLVIYQVGWNGKKYKIMAIFATIIDTVKTGWITVETNMLFNLGVTSIVSFDIRKDMIYKITNEISNDEEFILVDEREKTHPYTLTFDTSSKRFMAIESVNGVEVTSNEDLKTKILALLP